MECIFIMQQDCFKTNYLLTIISITWGHFLLLGALVARGEPS